MKDSLSRSNSQSNLPNYGQDKLEDKKNNVGTDNQNASAQSDKNASRGNGENKQAKPQLKSKEEKRGGNLRGRQSEDPGPSPDVFGQLFFGVKSSAAKKFDESSSEEDQLPSSPRQQQPTAKEKNTNPKVPKLSLQNLGNPLKGLASDRKEMTISPRKTRRETTSTTTTTTATSAPSWTPASPRAVSHPVQSSNLQAFTPTMTTTATATATTTTTKNTNTTTTTTTLAKSIAKSMPPVEKTTTSTPRGFLNLLPGGEKTKKIKGEKQGDSDVKTKVSGSVVTPADKKMTGKFPASMLTSAARNTISLALSGQNPTGDQLAELIICIESQGYTSPIDKGKVTTIYRGASTVGDFEFGSGDDQEKTKVDINIVNLVQNELLAKHLDVKQIQGVVKKIAGKYKEVAPLIPSELGTLDPKSLRKNEFFAGLIKPLTDFFFEELFGKEMKLSTSGFSPEFRNFLKGIDAGIIKWANNIGDVDQDLLLRLRKSAIAGYINTRGIAPIVYATLMGKSIASPPSTASVPTQKEAEEFKSAKLDILNRYLATVINHQIDEFYFDIMSHTEDQGEGQEKRLKAYGKAYTLAGKKSGFNVGRANKDSGTDSAGTVSPRAEKKLAKESQDLQLKRYGIRSKEISKFLKDSKIKSLDSNFLNYLRDYLSKEPRENYKKFLEAKAEYILVVLDKYIKNNPNKLKNEKNFVQEFRKELLVVVDQEKNARLSKKNANSVSVAQTTTSTAKQTEITQVDDSSSLLPSQTNIADDDDGQSSGNSLGASEELAPEELAKSSLEEPLPEEPTAEEATANVPGNSAAALERIKQAGLMESPFDDSNSSSSQ